MGRWYSTRKNTVESCLCLSLSRLRQWGYLKSFASGTVQWKSDFRESEIGVTVSTMGSNPSVELKYTVSASTTGEGERLRYPIELISTPCTYGGKRWWFVCPLVQKEGTPCSRKVYKLYLPPGVRYFGCRFCHNLTYYGRQNHNHRLDSVRKLLGAEVKIEKIRETMKRTSYRGKPTKKCVQYLKYENVMEIYSGVALIAVHNMLQKYRK